MIYSFSVSVPVIFQVSISKESRNETDENETFSVVSSVLAEWLVKW